MLYGADAKFWHRAGGAPGFKGLKLCCATVATHVAVRDGQRWRIVEHHEGVEYRDVRSIRYSLEEGLSADPAVLASGGNSGYQAAGLAAHLTGTGIVALLGYDMKPGPGGALHHHPDHPDHNPTPAQMAGWAKAFEGMARDLGKFPGLRIVNCTPDSAIDAFPRAALEDLL